MAPPGPFTSAALFVGALIGTPFVIDQFKNPTSQERIAAAVDSLKEKLHVHAPPTTAVIKEVAVPVVEAKATTQAPLAPTTTNAPSKEAVTPAPLTQAPPKATTTNAPVDKKWSTAAPGEADSSSPPHGESVAGATSETAPNAKQSTEPKQPAPSPKADAKESFKDVMVQQLEVNAIAFDRWCSGPLLRQRLSVHLKGLGVLAHLEKFQAYAGSVAEGVGLSSVAASAIMSLALVADFALLALFVLWRLCKCVRGPDQNPRQKRIDEIKKSKENGGAANPKTGSNASPKNGDKAPPKSPPKAPTSARKNRK